MASAVYLRSVPDPGSGASLIWLTKMGLVNQFSEGERSLTTTSIFVVNDENALIFLTSLAVILSCVALILAFIAEWRREPTLYLSAGYTCGALALYQYQPSLGFVSMVAGIAVSMVLRHDRRTREDT